VNVSNWPVSACGPATPSNANYRPPLPLAIVSFRVIEFARPFQKNVPLRPAGQLIRFHRRVMN
jgi:hypothetical protein